MKMLLNRKCEVTILLGPAEIHTYPFWAAVRGTTIKHTHDAASLVEVMKSSDLFIGNDSGPAHVAALFGVPTITLFGPTDPRRCAPRGKSCVAIFNKAPCAPCHFKNITCKDYHCMNSISVDQVWKEVIKKI